MAEAKYRWNIIYIIYAQFECRKQTGKRQMRWVHYLSAFHMFYWQQCHFIFSLSFAGENMESLHKRLALAFRSPLQPKKCKSTFAIGNVHVRIFPLMQKNQTKPNRTKHKNISTTTLATNAIFTFAFFRIGDTSSLGDNLWNLSTSFILYFMDEFCWSSIFVICCGFFLSFFGFYSFVCDVCVCLLIFV